jgi:uroporphyrinogen III methyltransferase/synthase
MIKSTVYLIGAGPGDYKLITLRGLELIKKADCIIYDYLVNPRLLKFAPKRCRLIYVGKKAAAHTLPQDKINQLLLEQARNHSIVVRLKGGDPFIFGRGAEEALYLKKKRINFEIVPGVSSAIAVPAYAGIPLTERNKNSTVGFITGHEDPTKKKSNIDWDALVKALGTMVFLMGVANLGVIVKRLLACGKPKNTPVAVIRWGTMPKQKTLIGNLGNIVHLAKKNKIAPPAIVVVGEVVRLRKHLKWFESRPLLGKRIVITRTRHQASAFSEKLTELGAEVIEIPTIKIISLKADNQLRELFLHHQYDWVFFTSHNGVEEFSKVLHRLGKDSRIFGKAKVCAIGSETAKSLSASLGIEPDFVPTKFCAEAVVEYFKNIDLQDREILILRAKNARNVLPEGLKRFGATVRVVDLYKTVPQKESASSLKEVFKQRVDFVTFTSSSTVHNFLNLLGKKNLDLLNGTRIASIGPVTSQTMRKFGLKVNIEAKVYTIKGLIEAIVKSN